MIALDALLSLSLLPASALSRLSGQNNLLGGACFSHPAAATAADDLPLLAVDMPLLNGEAALCEVWHSPGPMQSGRQGAIRYRENDSLLFGCLSLAETSPDGRPPLQLSAEAAYQSIFELLEARGHAANVWSVTSYSELTREALAYLEQILGGDSPYIYRGLLQPGMGLISNNVLHDRAAFTDDAAHKRHYYRARYFDRLAGTGMLE